MIHSAQRSLSRFGALHPAGQPDRATRITGMYLVEAPRMLQALREAIACGDAAVVRRTAHSLKSGSVTLGAMGLFQQCKALEAVGQTGDLTHAEQVLALIDLVYRAVRAALEAEMACSSQVSS